MAERYDDDDAWRVVLRALVSGISHDLSGRVTALAGAVHVARMGGLDAEVVGILEGEVDRLAASSALLRALPVGPGWDPETFVLGDLLREVGRLYACRAGARPPDVRIEDAASTLVHAAPGVLSQALLLLLAAAEANRSARAPLLIRTSERDDLVVVRIESLTRPGDPEHAAELDAARAAAAARARIEWSGGKLEIASGAEGVRYSIRLPAFTP